MPARRLRHAEKLPEEDKFELELTFPNKCNKESYINAELAMIDLYKKNRDVIINNEFKKNLPAENACLKYALK